ncbi:MAG: hypothetical protein MUC58_11245 [Rhizobiaceae bacterium]|jgi:hypothetical protein|nr:hypothetical protein [Rhizobiaceae bacterium]
MTPMRRLFQMQTLEIALCDSVWQVSEEDAGRVVITGSHGGSSSAVFALGVPALLYVFNDAGLGKDNAGVAGLKLLNDAGIAAVTVFNTSARIGEADDTMAHGIVSQCNRAAHAMGLRAGQSVGDVLMLLTV